MTDPNPDRAEPSSEDITSDVVRATTARRRGLAARLLDQLGLVPVWRDEVLRYVMSPAVRAAEYRRRRDEGARPIEALAGAYGPRGGLSWGRA